MVDDPFDYSLIAPDEPFKSRQERINFIRNTINMFIGSINPETDQPYNLTGIRSAYRDIGVPLSDAKFRELYNDALQDTSRISELANVPLDEIPDPGLFITSRTELGDNYRYVFRLIGSDTVTGEDQLRSFALDLEEPLTKQEAIALAAEKASETDSYPMFSIESVDVFAVYKNKG